jgi:Predicted acyltransferase
MIKKAELPETLAPFVDSVFGCRILSTAGAYGFHEPFAQIWTQDDRAALCKLDDVMVLEAHADADYTEISDFIRMSGAQRLLCSAEVAERTGFSTVLSGQIMAYHKTEKAEPPSGFELNPSLRELYALLNECRTETFVPPEFEPFYLDLSHRIRHGTALSAGIRQGETLVSCAVCIAKTEDRAIVSAVACKPEWRRQGYGHAALAALVSQLEQRKIFVFRMLGENEAFYRSFGFTPSGVFTEQNI